MMPRSRTNAPADAGDRPVTASVEDYLKAIYELERASGAAAATNELAERLDVAPASVTGMVRRLAEQGLIDYEKYRGMRLTADGRTVALRTIRRHRILETFLSRALGMPWDSVHAEAEQLEHATSDAVIDRMAHWLGDPAVDPHGAPIPSRDGTVDETRLSSIADLEVGHEACVVRVSDRNGDLLRYLAEIALVPGATVTLLARAPFEGPLTLRVGGEERLVGPALARQVLVESRVDG
ncbi:MAG: metal-dependent transcriptional regulator [Gemmatimonadaceae bacterium]|jgi:DtxR family Mn-dependent transcriptional regulator|nr:metal-dependent transcriptional regulator [Gemmatimonadaceae bacterium]